MAQVVLTDKEIKEKYGIDLVTAETIRLMMIGISRQMFQTEVRGAFSIAVRDIMDNSCAIHMVIPEGCDMVAVTEGCTQHAFTVWPNAQMILKEWGPENLHEGDVIVANDGFRGAIHQADVNLIRAVFWKGELVFYVQDVSHFIDMGGPAPGGFWGGAQDLYQEGLRFPPMLLYSRDVPVRSTFNLILEDTRTPAHNLGDLRANYGALVTGDRLLHDLIERFGLEAVRAGCRYSIDYVERSTRAGISEIPDGAYESEAYLDDDGVEIGKPIKLKCRVIKKGDSLEIDFSGTQRQSLGNTKAGWVDIPRSVMGVKLICDPFTPVNAGLFRAVDVVVPAGCQFCPLPPASISNHMETGPRAIGMVYDSLGKASPEKAIGWDSCTPYLTYYAGIDMRPGKEGMPWAAFFLPGGGWGGWNGGDGITFCLTPIGNCRTSVIEHIEQEMPLVIWSYEALQDSAGPGKYRGGFASQITIENTIDSIYTQTGSRLSFYPPGARDGGQAGPCFTALVKKDEQGGIPIKTGIIPGRYLDPVCGKFDAKNRPDPVNGRLDQNTKFPHCNFAGYFLPKGTVCYANCTGGGGWGDPLERDVERVRKDVRNALISVAGAGAMYGVIIDPATLAVDEKATASKRAELKEKRARGEWRVPVAHPPSWPE